VTVSLPASTSEVIARAYAEDLGDVGDVTTLATIPEHHRSVAHVVARVPGCMAGIPAVAMCFRHIDPDIDIAELAKDGQVVDGGTVVLQASGSTRSLLTAERVALNVLGQLSGIATATHAFVEAVRGTGASISDTRKTTPGLRALEKYAVAMGGGSNHRMGLYDAALIKDNHLAASDSIPSAVAKTRDFVGTDVIVEVEVDTLEQLAVALSTDANVVLLDNMNTAELASAVDMVGDRMRTEASGGVTMESVREIADTGVDVISVGWLTHSAPALDVAMDLESTIHDR
jgi:nicotinate-nucleotide pyrophosphorylase (carboxylating)